MKSHNTTHLTLTASLHKTQIMKNLIAIILIVSFTSCNSEQPETQNQHKNPTIAKTEETASSNDDAKTNRFPHYYWLGSFDTVNKRECLTRQTTFKSLNMAPNTLIDILNQREAECKVKFLKEHMDTIFIEVENASYLTQQMGSSGSWTWLAETTFTLTELKKIENVKMKFTVGDHAQPGNYKRDMFNDLLIKSK